MMAGQEHNNVPDTSGGPGTHGAALRASLSVLPFPLALVLDEYARETVPFIRLWRLVDAAELLTRFVAVVLLADLLRQHEGKLPDDVVTTLAENAQFERPTFGTWRRVVEGAVKALPKDAGAPACFVPGLPALAGTLVTALGAGGDAPEARLIPLRNRLAHAGRLPEGVARELLAAHEPTLRDLASRLDVFAGCDLVAHATAGDWRSLRGLPITDGAFPPLADASSPALAGVAPGRVLLLRGDEALDLFPLHLFGEVLQPRTAPHAQGEVAAQIYFRLGDTDQLEYTALSDRAPISQQASDPLRHFARLFRAQRSPAAGPFDRLMGELRRGFTGRAAAVESVRAAVQPYLGEAGAGLFWIGGRAGIGKSALMAALVASYREEEAGPAREIGDLAIFPYFFRRGQTTCSADAFLQALADFARRAAGHQPTTLSLDPEKRLERCHEYLARAHAYLSAANERKGNTILLLLDGLDEIAHLDRGFSALLGRLAQPGVTIVAAGRPDDVERAVLAAGATAVFPGGLPPLDEEAIRAMLAERLGRARYALFRRDEANGEDVARFRNRVVEVVTTKAEGLPLYVALLIPDLLAGRWSLDDPDRLPQGLKEYYDQLLRDLGISDAGRVLVEVLCLLAWAREPLTAPVLEATLLADNRLRRTSHWGSIWARVFAVGGHVLRRAPTADGEDGWTLYHDEFRSHLRQSVEVMGSIQAAQGDWLAWCARWQEPTAASLHRYALRHYAGHLQEAGQLTELYIIARSETFLQAQSATLTDDPTAPLRTLRRALEGAIDQNDAVRMAEYTLGHARWSVNLRRESPLVVLRNGYLSRALELIELSGGELRPIWCLLLAWELQDGGRTQDALQIVDRLFREPALRPPSWQILALEGAMTWQDQVVLELLAQLAATITTAVTRLSEQLLGFDGRDALFARLVSSEQFTLAHDLAQAITDEGTRADALSSLAMAQARAGDVVVARTIAESITSREDRLIALAGVVGARSQVGQPDTARADTIEIVQEAMSLPEPSTRLQTLKSIAVRQAQTGAHEFARETIAAVIGEDRWRVWALIAVAETQVSIGETALAHETLEAALETARPVRDLVRDVVVAQANAGAIDPALRTATIIADSEPGSDALMRIAEAQIVAGDVAGARETALRIPRFDRRRRVWWGIGRVAETQARARKIEDALSTADLIEDRESQARTRESIASIMRRPAEDEGVADVEDDTLYSLLDIATLRVGEGQGNEARTIYARLLQGVQDDSLSGQHPSTLCAAASLRAEAGNLPGAQELIVSIEDVEWRAIARSNVAAILAREGKVDEAREALALALMKVRGDPGQQALRKIALTQAEVGQVEGSLEAAQRLSAGPYWDYETVDFVLAKMVTIHLRSGSYNAALRTARAKGYGRSKALGTIIQEIAGSPMADRYAEKQAVMRAIVDEALTKGQVGQGNAELLADVASAFMAMGRVDEAREYLELARVRVRSIADAYSSIPALARIAVAQVELNDQSGASITFEDARQRIVQIDPVDRASMLVSIATAQAQAGDRQEAASDTFAQACDAAQAFVRVPYEQLMTIHNIVVAQAEAKQYAEALHKVRLIAHPTWQETTQWQDFALREVAIRQARHNHGHLAVATAARITVSRSEYLPDIASELLMIGDTGSFQQLLLSCAYDLNSAYMMCGLLIRAYPARAAELRQLLSVDGVG